MMEAITAQIRINIAHGKFLSDEYTEEQMNRVLKHACPGAGA